MMIITLPFMNVMHLLSWTFHQDIYRDDTRYLFDPDLLQLFKFGTGGILSPAGPEGIIA